MSYIHVRMSSIKHSIEVKISYLLPAYVPLYIVDLTMTFNIMLFNNINNWFGILTVIPWF
jgi:hypothetical protein